MKKVDRLRIELEKLCSIRPEGVTAWELSETLSIDRANVSRYLNQLCSQGVLGKHEGRPVRFYVKGVQRIEKEEITQKKFSLDYLIGASKSLYVPIQQAKAAILYPPRGLHTIILGETGVGKSMFAELMYQFSKESSMITPSSPFVRFNCADYAENPQLLVSQIFGVKKGAYTGADKDREGLLKKADGGILFLDEVHRLSNQGQEMLFTFIDKGYFRKLGDTEEKIYAQVQIIAATTENPASALLSTFTRRIPMTIVLPTLKERGLKDRYLLVEVFIKEESKRLQKSIYINRIALESFLLYDCPSNIGQLKSDIQLSCAKAFLNFRSQRKNYILIEQSDLPQNVKRGYMNIKSHRQEIDKLLKQQEDIYKFYFEENETYLNDIDTEHATFYEAIENRLEELRMEGHKENDINDIMSLDIEKHFQKYLTEIPKKYRKEEISKLVSIDIAECVEELLKEASVRLGTGYDETVYFGLALHLQSTIERMRSGKMIYHPKLNFVRVNYPDAFLLAMELAKKIDTTFDVETPLDEIGYLAMFFASKPFQMNEDLEDAVGILVIMHGVSTATSMVQVANELVGTKHCEAIDMPLTMQPEYVYNLAKEKILKLHRGKGVMLLVDMGSLINFADMISEETGIPVKSVDRVTTPMVLEAARKAVLGRELLEINRSCLEMVQQTNSVATDGKIGKKNVIITACFTGEGAGETLKNMIRNSIDLGEWCDVVNLNILNRREFLGLIDYYKSAYHVIAVVTTVDINLPDVPVFSAVDLLAGDAMERIKALVSSEDVYSKISGSLGGHLKMADSQLLMKHVRHFIEQNAKALRVSLTQDVKIGIALHLSFLVDNLMRGYPTKNKEDLTAFMAQYEMEMTITRENLWQMQQVFQAEFSQLDIAYLCKMFMMNHQ